jgi:hypothetical protein
MSNLRSRQVRWFALLLTLVLIPVTYLLSASGKVQVNAEALKLFAPLPAVMSSPDNPVTDAKVTLGRILYYDPRLSANQKIARNRPDIRVLYMSAAISPLEWDDYKEKPAGSYFIEKPFRSEELKALLMAIFAERRRPTSLGPRLR